MHLQPYLRITCPRSFKACASSQQDKRANEKDWIRGSRRSKFMWLKTRISAGYCNCARTSNPKDKSLRPPKPPTARIGSPENP